MSEEDLELWLDAMDGKEPVYERPLRPSDASQTFLDEAGFNFIQRCIQVLEYRGEYTFEGNIWKPKDEDTSNCMYRVTHHVES